LPLMRSGTVNVGSVVTFASAMICLLSGDWSVEVVIARGDVKVPMDLRE
jgi:hypothetical protein